MKRGFTLIELLVVIAIVGLLSSVILTSLNTARAKARDAVRIHDLRQIQSALQLYWEDHDYKYPNVGEGDCWGPYCFAQSGTSKWDLLGAALEEYIALPEDPAQGPVLPGTGGWPWGGNHRYVYLNHNTNFSAFDVIVLLENDHPNACPNTIHYSDVFPIVTGVPFDMCAVWGDLIVGAH